MSGARQCEGHAQFHRRKLLKASSNQILSDSTFCLCFSLSLFSPGASIINSKLFSSRVFTLRCFHYANTQPVAGFSAPF